MHSKKWVLVFCLVFAFTITGCTACGYTSTYKITVCKKTDDKVLAANGFWYELKSDTVHKNRLKKGGVFEVEVTHLSETEGEDKFEINKVFRETEETPEFCS